MGKKSKSEPKQIDVHYIKTNNYRTYFVDGIFGGLTPTGKIYMELFLQRLPTPQITQCAIENGTIGKELKRIGKEGIIREIESGLIFDISTAKVIRDWLDEKIIAFEKQSKLQNKEKIKKKPKRK